MTSSKLSGRKQTAKKPGICVSIPPDKRFSEVKALCRIIWTWTTDPPPPIDIDDQQILDQLPGTPEQFHWSNPAAGPNQLVSLDLTAPFDATHNALIVSAKDQWGTPHYSETYWTPSASPPFSADVNLASYEYTSPGTILAQIRPCPV